MQKRSLKSAVLALFVNFFFFFDGGGLFCFVLLSCPLLILLLNLRQQSKKMSDSRGRPTECHLPSDVGSRSPKTLIDFLPSSESC